MELPERFDSKFRFVLLAAQRAEQMMRGARPRIDSQETKATTVAMEEIQNDAVAWDYGPPAYAESESFDEEFDGIIEAENAAEG